MQQELRWLAIFSQDRALLEVYQKGLDMHSRITCQVLGFDYELFEDVRNYKQDTAEETTANLKRVAGKWGTHASISHVLTQSRTSTFSEETIPVIADYFELSRKKMKSVTFGTVYGISEIGLSDQLNISKEEAKALIDGFKSSLPGYLNWEARTHKIIKEQMYVEDVMGRKRRFGETIIKARQTPEFKQRGWHWQISKCMRQGVNYQIQGSSASQVKQAMVNLHYPLRPDGTRCLNRREWLANGYESLLEKHDSYISLQIHDEVVFNVPSNISQEALKEFAHTMATAIDVSWSGIQFKSDAEIAPYWAGKFTPEEIQAINNGELDWKQVMEDDARKKIARNLGDEYAIGLFASVLNNDDDDELDEAV